MHNSRAFIGFHQILSRKSNKVRNSIFCTPGTRRIALPIVHNLAVYERLHHFGLMNLAFRYFEYRSMLQGANIPVFKYLDIEIA